MATHSSILAQKSHGQKNLAGYSPWGHKRVRHYLVTKQQWNGRVPCAQILVYQPASGWLRHLGLVLWG